MLKRISIAMFVIAGLSILSACGKEDPKPSGGAHVHADGSTHGNHTGGTSQKPAGGSHVHADGSTHTDHAKEGEGHGQDHEEVKLGNFDIEGIKVDAAQGHGKVEPGKEGHLVIKLPYNDNGATSVRAWIGTEDRTASMVGKGEHTVGTGTYNVHAVAPKPLPEGSKWWVEIEKPDGTKAVGSIAYLTD